MKVYELINRLKDLPAGKEVMINGNSHPGDPFPIMFIDGDEDPESTALIFFDDNDVKITQRRG